MRLVMSALLMCFMLACASFASAPEPESVNLAITDPVGTELRYTYEYNETSVRTTPGEPARRGGADHSLGINVKLTRRDENGGSAEVSLYWYATAATSSAGRKIGFDSSSPRANAVSAPLAEEIAPLLNKPVTIHFDAGGAILDVSGVEALQRTQFTDKLITELFSLSAMRRKVGPILGCARVPAQVTLGDTWMVSDTIPLTLRFSMDIEVKRKLARIAGDTAVVEDSSQILIAPVDADAPVIAVLDNGTGAGSIAWNIKQGRLGSFEAHHRMLISYTVDGGDPHTMNVMVQESLRPAN